MCLKVYCHLQVVSNVHILFISHFDILSFALLMMTQGVFVSSVDQDQAAQNMQSDL